MEIGTLSKLSFAEQSKGTLNVLFNKHQDRFSSLMIYIPPGGLFLFMDWCTL